MRVFEMTAHVQKISRAEGRSATAAAAYRACTLIACEREDREHDFRRKTGLEASAIVLPAAAPAWAAERSSLWNAAELRERNGSRGRNAGAFKANAVTAREVMFGFPAELSQAGRLAVAHAVARHLTQAHRVAADFSIHLPGKEGDQRNFHCHMMFTTRRVDAAGLGEKTREWDDVFTGSRTIKAFRAFLAATMNEALAREGLGSVVHVEHRSHATRGSGVTPTRHQGPGRTNARRTRTAIERKAWERTERVRQAERHREDRDGLRSREDRAGSRMADIADRERKAVAGVAAELAAQRAADRAPKPSISRLMAIASGQAARMDAQRQQRDSDRQQQADRRVADLKAAFNTERAAVTAALSKETQATRDRHAAEDRQLDRAVSARVAHDRLAEVAMRRSEVAPVHDRQQDHQHERQRSPE